MIFTTQSGSTYEVDDVQQRIRRLNGLRESTTRQGTDGAWRQYESISTIEAGNPVLIQWEGVKCTLTSAVVDVVEDKDIN